MRPPPAAATAWLLRVQRQESKAWGARPDPAPSPGPVSTEPRTGHHHDDTQDGCGPCPAVASGRAQLRCGLLARLCLAALMHSEQSSLLEPALHWDGFASLHLSHHCRIRIWTLCFPKSVPQLQGLNLDLCVLQPLRLSKTKTKQT